MPRSVVDSENQHPSRVLPLQNFKENSKNEVRSQQRRVFGDVANSNRQSVPSKTLPVKVEQDKQPTTYSEESDFIERETMFINDAEQYPNTVYENPIVIREETNKILQGFRDINNIALGATFSYPTFRTTAIPNKLRTDISQTFSDDSLDIYHDDSANTIFIAIDDVLDEYKLNSDDEFI